MGCRWHGCHALHIPGKGVWVQIKLTHSGQMGPRTNANSTLYTLRDLVKDLGLYFPSLQNEESTVVPQYLRGIGSRTLPTLIPKSKNA